MSELVKFKLYGNGWHKGMSGVKFPVVVSGKVSGQGRLALISDDELSRIGCDMLEFTRESGVKDDWSFFIGRECEIIND